MLDSLYDYVNFSDCSGSMIHMPTIIVAAFLSGILCVSAAGDTSVRVVTYNIHHAEGTDGKLDLERIARVIFQEHPDIVCLQEVDRDCARTNGLDMPEELARLLDMEVVFGPNLDFNGGEYGNATLTRFPIVASENFSLPFVENGERRGCLQSTLEIEGRRVDVLNTHFDLLEAARKEQAARIVDLTRIDVPTIMAGDLNTRPDSLPLRVLLRIYTDTFTRRRVTTPQQPSHTSAAARIDFILVSGPLNAVSSRFVVTPEATVASDHVPYVADLSLGPPPETAEDKGVRDNKDERIEQAIIPGE